MNHDEFFGRALARIGKLMLAMTAAGAAAGLAFGGWRWAGGFALGAAASYLNFTWLKQLVEALGGGPARGRGSLAVVIGLRYLLLAAGAYVILNFSPFSLAGAFLGLFVPVAAVVAEILFELIYART